MAGFYRYKFDNLTVGSHEVTFTAADGTTYKKTVIVKPFCDESKYLKYIDNNGYYRFYPFNKFFEIKGSAKAIGTINKIVENIKYSQSTENQIGYENTVTVELTAEGLTFEELTILSAIYESPRVYYYIGSGADELKDWLEVTVKSKDGLYRKKKGNCYNVELTITLPERQTIKML